MSVQESADLESISAVLAAANQMSAGPLQVLVAEDDEADAYIIRQALRDSSVIGGIAIARDGEEALALMRTGGVRPDLAIVDLSMPRKGGMELLVDLACGGWPRFPVVVLTSSKASVDLTRARLRGAHAVITKPDTLEELEEVLAGLVDNAFAIHQERTRSSIEYPASVGSKWVDGPDE